MESDPDSVSLREACERNQDTVVPDLVAAHVDAVMREAETRRNEVRAQRWLFISR